MRPLPNAQLSSLSSQLIVARWWLLQRTPSNRKPPFRVLSDARGDYREVQRLPIPARLSRRRPFRGENTAWDWWCCAGREKETSEEQAPRMRFRVRAKDNAGGHKGSNGLLLRSRNTHFKHTEIQKSVRTRHACLMLHTEQLGLDNGTRPQCLTLLAKIVAYVHHRLAYMAALLTRSAMQIYFCPSVHTWNPSSFSFHLLTMEKFVDSAKKLFILRESTCSCVQ